MLVVREEYNLLSKHLMYLVFILVRVNFMPDIFLLHRYFLLYICVDVAKLKKDILQMNTCVFLL